MMKPSTGTQWLTMLTLCAWFTYAYAEDRKPDYNPLRNAYFGDLHIHTQYSFDAFIFNVRATPDDAYRYAKGAALPHPSGYDIRLKSGPLDFAAVTDHAEYLGGVTALGDPAHPLSKTALAKTLIQTDPAGVARGFEVVVRSQEERKFIAELNRYDVKRSAWQQIIAAAERHYQPGKFTTFIGYEYSSTPQRQNLHRNVIFKSSSVPDLPFGAVESPNPEDLWRWLDPQRARGIESLAIPHNANVSNGLMFRRADFSGQPLTAEYAEMRMRNEPLAEVSQVKGTSETHPFLSPNDEWAGFELYDYLLMSSTESKKPGGFVREAYIAGIDFEQREGFNPFKFGLIGSSDTHNAGGPVEEPTFFGKVGIADGTPQARAAVPLADPKDPGQPYSRNFTSQWGAAGLAGVWAEENTRESLYAALRRKETFATSGPRMRVRFFAGYDYTAELLEDPRPLSKAYAGGVSMGGDLQASGGRAPSFLVWAVRDANSAWLQRLQIVKGWNESGGPREQVFDVACSDGLQPDPETHRCPDNGAKVDLSDCSYPVDKGAVELRAIWDDPKFDPALHAVYYVRVLENPTCRHSTWYAVRAGVAPNPALPITIQERAWSSPIWYIPQQSS